MDENERFEGTLPELALVRGELRVSFQRLGESLYGDEFDEEDGADVEVLRFSVEQHDPDGAPGYPWQEVENSSYCTQIRADSDEIELRRMLLVIMDTVSPLALAGRSLKRSCEELSWLPERFHD